MALDLTKSVSNLDATQRPQWLRTVVIALGLTYVSFYWTASGLISPLHLTVYHWEGSAFALFAPVWVVLIGIWFGIALVLFSTRWNLRWRRAVWLGILVALPTLAVISFRLGMGSGQVSPGTANPNHSRNLYLLLYGFSPVVWAALLVCWRPRFDQYLDRCVRFLEVILIFSGIGGAALIAQLAWFNWKAEGVNAPPVFHARTVGQATKPRIIWLVMDELSYQQVYEQRYPGLALPAFDRLAKQATVFTQVIPVGSMTDRVMPALLSGRQVEDLRSTSNGQLWTREATQGTWQAFNQHDTVFQDAIEAGYSTGVSGWWNPYCRILPAVLDRCYWTAWFGEHKGLSGNSTSSAKLRATFVRAGLTAAELFPNRVQTEMEQLRDNDEMHVAETYLNIAKQGDDLLNDPLASFVLIHISIPHPVGMYNRATGQFSANSTSYIDNLALSDVYLGHLQAELEVSGEWDSTTLVVMGDHSWRTKIWRGHSWSETDEAASHGGNFDPRPGYIVKLPNQRQGTVIQEPFHALQTRRLMDALMHGQIATGDDLATWVRTHP